MIAFDLALGTGRDPGAGRDAEAARARRALRRRPRAVPPLRADLAHLRRRARRWRPRAGSPRTGGRSPGCAAPRCSPTCVWSRSPAFRDPAHPGDAGRRGRRQPRDELAWRSRARGRRSSRKRSRRSSRSGARLADLLRVILLTGAHRHRRLGAAAPAAAAAHAGSLPRARPEAAWARSGCGCRSRSATWPTRPRSATRCAASTPSSTWRRRSATSRAASIEELNAMATLRLVRARRARGREAVRLRLGDGREPPVARRASSAPRRSPAAP